MPLGRKSLDYYGAMSDSPLRDDARLRVEEFSSASSVSNSNNDRILRSSPRRAHQRSASPKKLYPNLDAVDGEQSYDSPSAFMYTNSLYPHIDREEYERMLADNAINESIEDAEQRVRSQADDGLRGFQNAPVPPVRKRKGQGDVASERDPKFQGRMTEKAVISSAPFDNLQTILIALAIFLLVLSGAALFYHFYSSTPTEDQINIANFERNFHTFQQTYNQEIHKDSMKMLHSALQNHVKVASSTDKANQYPTCILLAADKPTGKSINCLANDIARMIPTIGGVDPAHNVHTVDLTVKKFNHKNPDEEDLRSRVHHGINEGLNEGAKVIVFRNIEALLPDDVALMNLFYSYCDGDYPTFPKTLWILTLGTEDLAALKAGKFSLEGNEAKSMAGKVEKYLEGILEKASSTETKAADADKRTRNPILTRIANYIVPVLNVGRALDSCSIS